jgi:hypothetical protein
MAPVWADPTAGKRALSAKNPTASLPLLIVNRPLSNAHCRRLTRLPPMNCRWRRHMPNNLFEALYAASTRCKLRFAAAQHGPQGECNGHDAVGYLVVTTVRRFPQRDFWSRRRTSANAARALKEDPGATRGGDRAPAKKRAEYLAQACPYAQPLQTGPPTPPGGAKKANPKRPTAKEGRHACPRARRAP